MNALEMLDAITKDMEKYGVQTIRDALEQAEVVDKEAVITALQTLAVHAIKGLMPNKQCDFGTSLYSALYLAMRLGARMREERVL